jgi:hypothetical protein
MNVCRFAAVAMTAAACAWLAGCAVDTPKSVFQNSEEYANRVFVPSAVSGSVLAKATDNKPMPFNKISFSRSAKVMYQGALIDASQDLTYENAGNGLIRVIQVTYRNGVVDSQYFSISYRGMVPLRQETLKPTGKNMPYTISVDSISKFDSSFDQPSLSYVYREHSTNPRAKTQDRSGACTLESTYAGSKLAPGISGDAREFECKFYNDNGVLDADSRFVYLNAYGVVILKSSATTNFEIQWTVSNFKTS